jgi:hypothetical protein
VEAWRVKGGLDVGHGGGGQGSDGHVIANAGCGGVEIIEVGGALGRGVEGSGGREVVQGKVKVQIMSRGSGWRWRWGTREGMGVKVLDAALCEQGKAVEEGGGGGC